MRTVGGDLTSPALLAPGGGRKTLPARRNRKHAMFAAACIRHHPLAGVIDKRRSRPPLAREAAAEAANPPAMRGQFPNAFQGTHSAHGNGHSPGCQQYEYHTTVIFVALRLCLPVSAQSAVRYSFLHTIAYAEQPFDTRGSMVLLLPSP